jgi:Domain of unknown function (DUF4157)
MDAVRIRRPPTDLPPVSRSILARHAASASARSHWQVSNPSDPDELEAERVAAQVMTMTWKAEAGGTCRSAPAGREEEPGRVTARRNQGSSQPVPQPLAGPRTTSGQGSPLSPATRAFFERRFGHDFAQVRIHSDHHAAADARSIDAAAFTVGSHIWFGEGQYAPGSTAGRRLLAHELTHVIQQHSGAAPAVQRFRLRGFPPAEEAKMRVAVPEAMAKVRGCTKRSAWDRMLLPIMIDNLRYDYVPDLGACGWTFPSSWYVEIGSTAFSPSRCCDLASTIAHEAYHTEWHFESGSRELECDCFNCSC